MPTPPPPGAAPFRQGRFEDLPDLPRRPHPYFATAALDIPIASAVLGPMIVHVRRFGTGPPVLLVHGLMTSSYTWRYVLEPLGAHFTCYAPDLPGNGRSPAPLGPRWTPAVLAAWLGEVQAALGIRGCPVVANSMGGYLALHWAERDPAAMTKLVCVHAPGIPEARLYALKALLAVPGMQAMLRALIARDPERWAHRNVHYHDESLKSREEAREYGAPLATDTGRRALVKYLAETMDVGVMGPWHARLQAKAARQEPFAVPTLLLYSAADPMVPPRFGAAFAALLPGARLERLHGASHFAHVDGVDVFVPPVLAFLGG
ncbi:MAG: alpha/beta hydrolase [Myxococcales bacterium]|nr:alpha/beta hydrolase [Myxococcales bacterium]